MGSWAFTGFFPQHAPPARPAACRPLAQRRASAVATWRRMMMPIIDFTLSLPLWRGTTRYEWFTFGAGLTGNGCIADRRRLLHGVPAPPNTKSVLPRLHQERGHVRHPNRECRLPKTAFEPTQSVSFQCAMTPTSIVAPASVTVEKSCAAPCARGIETALPKSAASVIRPMRVR